MICFDETLLQKIIRDTKCFHVLLMCQLVHTLFGIHLSQFYNGVNQGSRLSSYNDRYRSMDFCKKIRFVHLSGSATTSAIFESKICQIIAHGEFFLKFHMMSYRYSASASSNLSVYMDARACMTLIVNRCSFPKTVIESCNSS